MQYNDKLKNLNAVFCLFPPTLALLAEGYNECQVASILKILKMAYGYVQAADTVEDRVTEWQRGKKKQQLSTGPRGCNHISINNHDTPAGV